MLPYALELGPVGRIATGMTNLLSRGTTSAAKALGGVTNATKFYKAAKHAIAPMAGLTANAHNVLAMAGGLANQEIADSAIVEDADGNYIYDTSRIDGKTITRNSMIQAAAEIGSEFSGGMLRNLFKAAGGNFASTGIRRLNILFRKI